MSNSTAKDERCAKCNHLVGLSRIYVNDGVYHPTCAPDPEITRLRAALDEALEVVEPFARPQNPQALPRDFDAARRFYEKHKGGGE